MSHENFQLSIDVAKIYESQEVAAIFRPLRVADRRWLIESE
jgi:hypothetical protein